ncbi:MAG: heat-inducible transcriptional repressor HrcA [Myxococcota bacterium]
MRDELVLSERQRDILTAVVEDFIATAEPVGSRTLTRRRSLGLSPATVRNTMADLEDLGLLSAPHASAGRIPTLAGFRIYVERLALRGRISSRDRELVHTLTGAVGTGDTSQVLREAGRVLSTVSRHASLVLMPSLEEVVFESIQFMPLRDSMILAVFVAKSGFIQHRVIDAGVGTDRDELTRMSNYLGSLLGGKRLVEVRVEILRSMNDERARADVMMRSALLLGQKALGDEAEVTVLLEGERTFLDQPEFADIQRMRKLLRAFEEKTLLLKLLDAATSSPIGAQAASSAETAVVLGSESNERDLADLAAVTATYATGDGAAGRVGIVGPTRMNYGRVIPLVELTAQAVSQTLSPDVDDDED